MFLFFYLGTYQPKEGQIDCILTEKGYYLNYFGSDGTNVKPKICPKGFVCTHYGLPKYYEICRVN
jgi:hypothetical protein